MMDDRDKDVEVKVTFFRAEFVGSCLRCAEPATGSFDSDEDDRRLKLRCVSCGFKMDLEIEDHQREQEYLLTFSG